MRFLCLHGASTSGAIFRAQTAAFRDKLGPGHLFDFVDAPHACPAGPGIAAFFPEPYYSFWRSTDAAEVAQTHHWLLERLRQPEPYDALLCFSQGCAVAASLIVAHQNETPELALPFRAVIFICGGPPLPILADWGLPIPRAAWEVHERTARELWEQATAKQAQLLARRAKAQSSFSSSAGEAGRLESDRDDPWTLPAINPCDAFGLDLTRFPESCRLHLPTVHIYGRQDPRCPSAWQLALLSDPTDRLVYDHGGAHEIPRTTRVSEAIAGAVAWLDDRLARRSG
ncbi:uncharacterized protein N7482_010640 [Penicillium canariense]|uniref:Serine hydrolase domain-containing protein n=1 Tax=Penicillium canariense TaxID=189055 RepID=A0A9W9LEH2_9EURO|nr:uncharacterized protein N7482_010640 [Penicillium canariense]KAJ5151388.1 hypothetical protein N7482_010640 [Penicillium canariense]